MYRQPAPHEPPAGVPRELAFEPTPRRNPAVSGLAVLQVFALPALVAGLLSVVASPTAGLAGMIASAGAGVWLWRRKPRIGAVLQVDGGDVTVLTHASRKVKARLPLAELAEVVLDTKTITPITDGGSSIPAMRLLDSRVGPAVDTARIALVDARGTRLLLCDDYLTHMDATEWFAKVRTFFRKHGWVPKAERGDADDGPDSGDDDAPESL